MMIFKLLVLPESRITIRMKIIMKIQIASYCKLLFVFL